MQIFLENKVYIYGMAMVQKIFYKKEVSIIENGISDLYMVFNGDILVHNIKVVIVIMLIKVSISYNKY